MKRLFFVAVLAVSVALVSCSSTDPTKEQCWEIFGKALLVPKVSCGYYWGTGAEVDEIINLANEYGAGLVTYTKKSVRKSQTDCTGYSALD